MAQRLALLIEYVGTAFSGSQRQTNTSNTVQERLETAFNRLNIGVGPVVLSGRTDAGVHAKGQVAHVDVALNALSNISNLRAALNAVLPDSIAIVNTALTPLDKQFGFHAIISAQWRWYQYRLSTLPYRSAWQEADIARYGMALDFSAMQTAAESFLGHQDFTSFQCPRTDIDDARCNVIHSQLHRDGALITFDIVANRFVYKMVRNMMGTLIDVGLGRIDADTIPDILHAKDRQKAGRTARPEGLSLMAVAYPEPWGFFDSFVYVKNLKRIIQEYSGT